MKVKKILNYIVYGLTLVALVMLATVAAIMASTQQNINSSIQVTYTPIEVNGSASAKYYVGASDKTGTALVEVDGVDENPNDNVLTFKDGTSSESGFQLNQEGEIKLTDSDRFVVYEYKFTNDGDREYVVSISSTLTRNNLRLTTYVSNAGITDFSTWPGAAKEFESDLSLQLQVPKKGECYAYIRFDIQNYDEESSVTGSFSIKLDGSKKALDYYEMEGTTITGLKNDSTLNNLVFPAEVEAIDCEFSSDSITSVHIGENITSISDNAFTGLKNLREVIIENPTISDNINESDTYGLLKYSARNGFTLKTTKSNSYLDGILHHTYTSGETTYTPQTEAHLEMTGETLNGMIKGTGTTSNDETITNIKFDYYTDPATGIETEAYKEIQVGAWTEEELQYGVTLYRSEDGTSVYVLSDQDIQANEDSSDTFENFYALEDIKFNNFFTDYVKNMYNMFQCATSHMKVLDISNFNTGNVTNMNCLFCNDGPIYPSILEKIIFGECFDTYDVTSMRDMFMCCEKLTSLDLSAFDTSSVTDMSGMFASCFSLTTLDLSSFDTSNVTNMRYMLYDCKNLETIYVGDGWNVNGVAESEGMFSGCTSLVGAVAYSADKVDATMATVDGYLKKRN